jgi:hypothetical protein
MKNEKHFELCSAFIQSSSFWREDMPENKIDGPVITISQAAGARGNPIAEELVRQLDGNTIIPQFRQWTLFNQNLVERVIEEHDLPTSTAGFFPEDKTAQLTDMIGEALGLHRGVYTSVLKTAETILRLAQSGNAIIVGRGGNFITQNIALAVHVRLVGTLEKRIESFARIYGVAKEEAEKEVARRDRARKSYIQENFQQDINEPRLYDFILNTDEFNDTAAARLIITAMEEKVRSIKGLPAASKVDSEQIVRS